MWDKISLMSICLNYSSKIDRIHLFVFELSIKFLRELWIAGYAEELNIAKSIIHKKRPLECTNNSNAINSKYITKFR